MADVNAPEIKIMKILQQHSDEEHPLTQAKISDWLRKDYDTIIQPKILRRLLNDLTDFDDDIEFEEIPRTAAADDSDGGMLRTNYYLRQPLSDPELRLLIDSVAFLSYLPTTQREALIEKLTSLGSGFFEVRSGLTSPEANPEENKELFLNIALLDEAIRKKRKISASYLTYDTNKRLYQRRTRSSLKRVHTLSPYQLVMYDGHYYLICNNDRHDGLAHYRVDRLSEVKILPERARPLADVASERDVETDNYIREHIYMYPGKTIRATIKIHTDVITDAVDLFGPAIDFETQTGDWVRATVHASPKAIAQFARIYAPKVFIVTPDDLRNTVRTDLEQALALYGKNRPKK